MSDYLDPHTVCGTHCEPGACPGFKPKPEYKKPFHPAFDAPETPEQALAVIRAWGDPLTMTFSAKRAKKAASLLKVYADHYEKSKPVIRLVLDLLDSGASFYPSAVERNHPGSIDFDVWQQQMLKALEGMTR